MCRPAQRGRLLQQSDLMDTPTLADELATAATAALDEIPHDVAELIARRILADDQEAVPVARFGSSI